MSVEETKKEKFAGLAKTYKAKEEDGIYDFGKITIEDWEKIYKAWKSMFGGGSRFCLHEWGESDDLPPRGIKAIVIYPNGVRVGKAIVYDWVRKCAKCGRIEGEEWPYDF